MDLGMKRRLEKQRYRVVGNSGAVKTCHWLREKLLRGRACYKENFYGISCHRCLQMTPTVNQCNENCLFCWRVQNFTETRMENVDDPVVLLDDSIQAHRELITGFKGDPRVTPGMWGEAWDPNQVAISLSGEPTIYPRLGEFIEECGRRGMTTFLVTNGTLPRVLANLDPLPTQLYVTVAAPNREIFGKLCSPLVPNAWDRLLETLELLPSLDVRTVIRHTLVNEWNLGYVDEYAALDRLADPLLIEPKGYVFVGASRLRMSITNMPSHDLIRDFTRQLGAELGYEFIDEQEASRVTLLSREGGDARIPSGQK